MVLQARLFGRLELLAGDEPVPLPASRRACELLAWLALHPGEHLRGTVAAQFWPDVLDTSARASLRSAAWAARKALGPAGDALITTRNRIGLRCATDLQRFDELLDQQRLEEAVALCRGALLADFDDDWVLDARDRHAERLAAALTHLADAAPTPDAAVAFARRRLELDPLDEAAARDLMRRLAAAGDRPGAIAVYDRLSDRLRTQLALAPSPPTRTLLDELRTPDPTPATAQAGRPPPPPPPAASPPPEGASPPPPAAPPLVGRDAELAELVAATQPGRQAIAVLAGEPGIGKTRLATELLARTAATGARTASCTALEFGGTAPFQLWAELLRDLADTVPAPPPHARWPDELAAVAPSLPARLGRTTPPATAPVIAPELARARLFEAAVDLLEHACADRPLLLVFEDVHAADARSLELLSYALRRFDRLPIAAVLTRRHVPPRADLDALLHAHRARGGIVTEISLRPLDRPEADALIRQVADLDAPARDRIAGVADGNPLLAVESARAAASGLEGPPPSLQAVVAAALAPLSPPARRVAELAAVASRPLTHAELDALGVEPADTLAVLESGLFAGDRGSAGFHHQLLLDAALAHLPVPRRRELHAELAEVIVWPAAEAARHLREAGQSAAAAERLASAAADAVQVGAVAEAIAYLREALDLRPDDPALLLDLANAYADKGLRAEAEDALARALAGLDPDDHAARGAAHLRAARWYAGVLCWPRRTIEEADRALAEFDWVPETDASTVAAALALGAWAEATTGDTARAETLLRRIDALGVEDPDLRYQIAHALAWLALRRGRPEEAMEHFAECIATGGPPDSVYAAWSNQASLAAVLGRIDEALELADRGLAAVQALGDLPPLVAPIHALRATLLTRLGRIEEARAAVAAERAAAERSGSAELIAVADHDEGILMLAAGEHERAAGLLERALAEDAVVSRPLARLARAEALARAGHPDTAEAELRAATLEPVRAVDRPAALVARLTHVQGLVALARDDRELAARRFEESAAAWRRVPAAAGSKDLLVSLVDLGRPTLGPVEPARELERVTDELRRLTPLPT